MEFIAEAMHASIDLTRPSSQDSVNIPPSPPSSSSSSSSSFLESSTYQQHHGIDSTNLSVFYRPTYPGSVEQQPNAAMFTPQYCLPQQERPPSQPPVFSVNSAEGDNHYDSMITNGMRVMHFMDHRSPEVFHQYPSLYMPDGLAQYSSGYYAPSGPIPTQESYPSIPSSNSSFSPVVIVPQPVYYNHPPTAISPGFQPYHQSQPQQSISTDSLHSKRVESGEQKGIKRKNSDDSESTSDEMLEIVEDTTATTSCTVCGDISSGLHYGVWACEGCKGFFRRAMMRSPEEPELKCFYNSDCNVNRETRNKCRACRLRRCLQVGMNFGNASKDKDIYKKRRPSTTVKVDRSMVHLDWNEWRGFVVAAHTASFTPVSDTFTSKYAAVLSLGSDQIWPPGSDLSKRGFQAIQHFAHSLPFVSFLPPDLRTHLLESNALDMMILRMIFRFCPERESFLFPPGAEVTIPCLSATLLGSTTVDRLAFLGRLVLRLGIGSEELAFLSTLALLSPNALNVGFLPGHVANLHEMEARVLFAFRFFMLQRWSSQPFLVGKLVAFLSDVRALQQSVSLQTWLDPVSSSSQSS